MSNHHQRASSDIADCRKFGFLIISPMAAVHQKVWTLYESFCQKLAMEVDFSMLDSMLQSNFRTIDGMEQD